jgi:hypothetical protein
MSNEQSPPPSPRMDGRHSSAPPPSTFPVSWSPSRTVALDPANLTITKREPRAWERAPRQPNSHDSRFKVVWKSVQRYDLRPRAPSTMPPLHSTPILDDSIISSGRIKSPERAVKRLRVDFVSARTMAEAAIPSRDLGATGFVGTKWQRRRSSLPSMCNIYLI